MLINLNDETELKFKLKEFDLIVDFSYPSGQLNYIYQTIQNNIKSILSNLQSKTIYLYMSSISAYGGLDDISYRILPRTSYAFLKRVAERSVKKYGKKYGLEVYIFRLGQVHGFLQSVNASFRTKMVGKKTIAIENKIDEKTNTVFVSTVAEVIVKCAERALEPGLHTLVSNPQWTLNDLYQYYNEYYGYNLHFFFSNKPAKKTVIKSFEVKLWKLLNDCRSLLETFVLIHFPSVSIFAKGKFRENEIRKLKPKIKFTDLNANLLGVPNQKLLDMKSDPKYILETEKRFDEFYHHQLFLARK